MQKIVKDHLKGILPNISNSGLDIVDFPPKEDDDDPFGLNQLKNLKNFVTLEDKPPEKFKNYFEQFKKEVMEENLDLDSLLSIELGDKNYKDKPVGSVLPYLLSAFLQAQNDNLEERCLNLIMRIFSQREELYNNIDKLQVIFDDEKSQVFKFVKKQTVVLSQILEETDIWMNQLIIGPNNVVP